MLVELTSLLQISRKLWALLLLQTQIDRILINALRTHFSTRICNTVSCYVISFIPTYSIDFLHEKNK